MPETRIEKVCGRRVWDSRGRPTVEAEVHCADGSMGRAIAPAGASRGSREAIDLRDGGKSFGGLDVGTAIANVNGEIAERLAGMDVCDQAALDAALIWPRCRRQPRRSASRCGNTSRRKTKSRCRCRKSRFSAAARMPAAASTSRISW
jgi:hypothetical protein